jgi:hypothetical protein
MLDLVWNETVPPITQNHSCARCADRRRHGASARRADSWPPSRRERRLHLVVAPFGFTGDCGAPARARFVPFTLEHPQPAGPTMPAGSCMTAAVGHEAVACGPTPPCPLGQDPRVCADIPGGRRPGAAPASASRTRFRGGTKVGLRTRPVRTSSPLWRAWLRDLYRERRIAQRRTRPGRWSRRGHAPAAHADPIGRRVKASASVVPARPQRWVITCLGLRGACRTIRAISLGRPSAPSGRRFFAFANEPCCSELSAAAPVGALERHVRSPTTSWRSLGHPMRSGHRSFAYAERRRTGRSR